jgi:hypothetical protein
MQNDSELDVKLEQAVASYADPADAGDSHVLTEHVLRAIDRKRQQRRWWFSLAFATPALACVTLIVFFAHNPSQPERQTVSVSHPVLPAAPPMETPYVERVHVPVVHARQSKPKNLPKLDQFPAPTPLTEQERLLVQFATQAPPSTLRQIAKTQNESDAPLRIAELTIPKLDSNPQPK